MTSLSRSRSPKSATLVRRTAGAHPVVNPAADLEQQLPPEVLAKLQATGLLDQISAAKDYEARSRAGSTRDNYARAWDAFVGWCDELGATSLPAQPELVAVYTAYLADTGGHGVKPDGSRAGRRPGTVSNHLVAIRAVHVDHGYGDPTAHPTVRRVLGGIKRVKGTRVQPREPMTYDLLERVVHTIDLRHELRASRDRVLLAAADSTLTAGQWRSEPERTGSVTTTQLAGAAWQDVTLLDEQRAVLTLRSRSNRTQRVELTIEARPGDPLCFVAALRCLASVLREQLLNATADALIGGPLADTVRATWQPGPGVTGLVGTLLPSLDRRGLPKPGHPSRQQLDARLGRAAQLAGLDVERTTAPSEDDWSRDDRARALDAVTRRPLADLRDRALLLMGWHLAARRSNLTWLRIGEIARADLGLDVHFRRSKTDQEQVGRDLAVVTIGGRFCPVAAWNTWRDAMRGELADLSPEFPAFPPLTPDGATLGQPREVFETRHDGSLVHDATGQPISLGLEGLCGDDINYLVKQRAADAGLRYDEHGRARPWGAHSLRRGWLTEGARQGIGLAELMAHSGHISHESVLAYIQAANRWSSQHSAPLKMRYDLRNGLRTSSPRSATAT